MTAFQVSRDLIIQFFWAGVTERGPHVPGDLTKLLYSAEQCNPVVFDVLPDICPGPLLPNVYPQ